jgi:shikimate 5-dehydrogenase
MIIQGATKVDAILGDPVAHFLSPQMHNASADGRSMLIAQGEETFLLWTGTAPPAGVMQTALSI